MNFSRRIDAAAEQAARSGPAPHVIDETDAALRFQCDLSACEQLACSFTRFELTNAAWASVPIEKLKRIAETLAAKLTYLLEPVRPIEADAEHCVVQMRSSPPRKDEDRTIYYELEVRRGGVLSLCRYEKRPGDARQKVAIQVTREVFRHLVDDFAAAA